MTTYKELLTHPSIPSSLKFKTETKRDLIELHKQDAAHAVNVNEVSGKAVIGCFKCETTLHAIILNTIFSQLKRDKKQVFKPLLEDISPGLTSEAFAEARVRFDPAWGQAQRNTFTPSALGAAEELTPKQVLLFKEASDFANVIFSEYVKDLLSHEVYSNQKTGDHTLLLLSDYLYYRNPELINSRVPLETIIVDDSSWALLQITQQELKDYEEKASSRRNYYGANVEPYVGTLEKFQEEAFEGRLKFAMEFLVSSNTSDLDEALTVADLATKPTQK